MREIRKSTFREIKSSFGRFMAIFAITALGVGFFAGLKVTKEAMIATVTQYLDKYAFYDFRLLSTVGFDQENVDSLASAWDVEAAEGAVSLDIVYQLEDGSQGVVKTYSMTDNLNTLKLVNGRMPEQGSECVADSSLFGKSAIGSTIYLSEDNEEEDLENFAYREYTIVGLVQSPLYLQYERGNTSLGSGRLDGYLYLRKDGFDTDYFTEIYVKFDRDYPLYSEAYDDFIEEKTEIWENLTRDAAFARYENILEETQEKLAEARAELEEKQTEGKAELADAEKALADAGKEIEEGEKALAEARKELEDGEATLLDKEKELEEGKITIAEKEADLAEGKVQIAEKEAEIAEARNAIDSSELELRSGERELAEGKAQLRSGEAALNASKLAIEESRKALQDKLKDLQNPNDPDNPDNPDNPDSPDNPDNPDNPDSPDNPDNSDNLNNFMINEIMQALARLDEAEKALLPQEEKLEEARQQINAAEQQLNSGWTAVASARQQVTDGQLALTEAKLEVTYGEQALAEAKRTLEEGEEALVEGWKELEEGKKTLTENEKEFDDAKQEYADGKKEYEDALKEFNEKIAEAREEIADAEKKLEELEEPDTYVLDRNTNIGYVCFENDSSIVEGIANIFPVFFFLVAALVCITTMNRMVEEQRTQIGVLKALGYGEATIMSKYMIYSGLAALGGCLFGFFFGTWGFPKVIWFCYGIMYEADPIFYVFNWKLAAVSLTVALLCSVGTTWLSCRLELSQMAAALMRPKAPKAGKRVFLEYIPFLWKHLGFLRKVSLRNIFRYKKRLFMMVVGISGCTALLVTGFGIKDSIADVASKQFLEIQTYDIGLSLKDDADEEVNGKLEELRDVGAGEYTCVMEKNMDLVTDNGIKSIYLVAGTEEGMAPFLDLHTGDKEPIAYPCMGEAVISNKLAEDYDIEIGDMITLRDDEMHELPLTVTAVYQNYIYNYVHISEDTWRSLMDQEPERKTVYMNLQKDAPGTLSVHELAAELMKLDQVSNVTVNADTMERIGNMMSSLNIIVIVVIFCAAGLAFIVLYNLTNINITERIREIATIKVLGFYKRETASYVFRENVILTAFGMAAGLGLGKLLHRFVMNEIRVDMITFDIRVKVVSYLYSAILTFGFAWLVNKAMNGKLEAISMTESLKSVD